MVDSLTVELAERSYPLHFESDVTQLVATEVKRLGVAGRKIVVLTDTNVARSQAGALRAMFGAAPLLVIPAGETSKSFAELERAMTFFAAQKLDRSGAVFAVGGGVIGDLAGFSAAAWLRGIAFYQVPTTLLAMVDSSVGGKTGINIPAGKNLVGAFHQPDAVYIGTSLLATLPPREFASGVAEVIKYGLLGDQELFEQLAREPVMAGSAGLAGIVRRCCALKAAIVAADERELAKEGGRALLNLGHTFGHAIEQVAGYGGYLHGEAIAIGLCAAARLSQKLGYLSEADVARVDAIVAAHDLPVRLQTPLPLSRLTAAMSRDKKVRNGVLRFVVMKSLGEAATQDDVSPALAEASFRDVGASE